MNYIQLLFASPKILCHHFPFVPPLNLRLGWLDPRKVPFYPTNHDDKRDAPDPRCLNQEGDQLGGASMRGGGLFN